jgi:short subunit dehydrogenase-like uncharacterized protein
MSGTWMIYGANGYTGGLAARVAKDRNFSPVLAGRHAGHIRRLARELGFESRVFDLADAAVAATKLEGVAAVLHCAGPFSATSRPMLAACLRAGTHYLDITGEIAVLEDIHSRSQEIKEAGIVAIPGVGFDVVPTDCLAAMLKRELASATHLKLAFKPRYGKLSPGTAKTMFEGLPEGGRIRENGRIVKVPSAYKVETIPFTREPLGHRSHDSLGRHRHRLLLHRDSQYRRLHRRAGKTNRENEDSRRHALALGASAGAGIRESTDREAGERPNRRAARTRRGLSLRRSLG